MFVRFRIACALLIFLTTFFHAYSQNAADYRLSADSLVNRYASENKVFNASRCVVKPKIDGQLDDACWKSVNWDDTFVQQQPNQAGVPSQLTEFAILYDDENLFVAIRCYDNSSEGFRSVLSRRDEYSGDMVGVAIDSYNDNRTAFEFDMTAAGQKIDLMHLGAQEADYNWDAIWDGKSFINDSVWTVEMRIPFSQIRFANHENKQWGLHVWRYIDRLSEEDHWKLIPVDAPATVYLFGDLEGIQNIDGKRKIELLPYGSTRFSPNTDMKNKWNYGAGLDGKVGLSSDFTLDFTINPDFGQIEADPSVLTLNAYEIFYDERRPFFLEGNNVLNYSSGQDLMYYSRRIGHAPSFEPDYTEDQKISMPDNTSILSALKITGKSKDGLSVGVVHSLTAKETATIYDDSLGRTNYTAEPLTNYLVGRVKKDFNEGNTVLGGMITSVNRSINDSTLNFLPSSAVTGGVDFVHNWKKRKYFVDVKTFFSQVKGDEDAISTLQTASQHYFQRPDANHLEYDPERTSLSGHGGALKGGKRSGKFRAIGSFSWRSPGVDLNDIGYIYQADYLEQELELKYMVNKPKGIMRNYWIRMTQNAAWSYGGEMTKQEIGSHAYLRFKNLYSLHLNFEHDYNIFDTRELRGGPSLYKESKWDGEAFLQTNPSRNLFAAFGSRYIWGEDQISNITRQTFYLLLRIGENLSLSSKTVYQTNRDYHQYAGRVKLESGDRGYIVGEIDQNILVSTLRLEYFITPELSLQYYGSPYASIGKYDNFRRVNKGSSRNLDERYIDLDATLDDAIYTFTEEGDSYRMYNPDFTFKEFNSNLVARWEFRPGSTLYFVWNNTLSDYQRGYDPSIGRVWGDVFSSNSANVFMMKFTYWFAL